MNLGFHPRTTNRSCFRVGLLTLCAVLAAVGCDKGDSAPPPSIENAEPEEAAEISAEAYCDYVIRCGTTEEVCVSAEPNPSTPGIDADGECTTVVTEVDPDTCMSESAEEFLEAYGCAELDAEAISIVDACLAALASDPCAYETIQTAEDLMEGETEVEVPTIPDACMDAIDVLGACAVSSGEPIEPGRG